MLPLSTASLRLLLLGLLRNLPGIRQLPSEELRQFTVQRLDAAAAVARRHREVERARPLDPLGDHFRPCREGGTQKMNVLGAKLPLQQAQARHDGAHHVRTERTPRALLHALGQGPGALHVTLAVVARQGRQEVHRLFVGGKPYVAPSSELLRRRFPQEEELQDSTKFVEPLAKLLLVVNV